MFTLHPNEKRIMDFAQQLLQIPHVSISVIQRLFGITEHFAQKVYACYLDYKTGPHPSLRKTLVLHYLSGKQLAFYSYHLPPLEKGQLFSLDNKPYFVQATDFKLPKHMIYIIEPCLYQA